MRYRGIDLIKAIKDGKIKDFAKIKVFYLGIPTKHILEVTRDNLMWKPGEFYVGELWNDEYAFEVIEEKPKKIEEIDDDNSIWEEQAKDIDYIFKNKIDELTKAVNYLLEKESDE